MTTIQASNGSISILKPGAAEPEVYPASAIESIPLIGNPGYVILKKVSTGKEVLPLTLYSNITNGDTGLAFASAAAVTTYVKANFFYKAPASGGTGANPTALVGLTATNGSATSLIRSDGAPALDQSISPTWTGNHTFSNKIVGISMSLSGLTASKLVFTDASKNLTSTGIGTSGQFIKGDGSLDSSTYITSASLPTGANPSASIGVTAVNGSASTFMRSDAAPALSQSIVPTWTGVHTFNATNIVTTSTPQFVIGTGTAATSGVPVQYSGMLQLQGLAWNGTASASQDVNFGFEVEPISANPVSGLLVLKAWVNGGAKSSLLNISNTGQFTSSNLIVLNQGFIGSTSTDVLFIQNSAASSAGTTLQKSGRIRYQGSVWNSTATAAANYFSFSNEAGGVSGLVPTGTLDWYGGIGTSTTVSLTKLMSLDAATGNLTLLKGGLFENNTLVAVNASATLTEAQVQSGIKTTSSTAVAFTMPTSTLLATKIGASQGTRFLFTIDNTASTSSGAITLTLGTGMTSGLTAGLTVAIGKVQTYLIVFTSATTCVMSQIL